MSVVGNRDVRPVHSVVVDTSDATMPGWVKAGVALEYRRIWIELAMQLNEIVEPIPRVDPMSNVASWEQP